MSLLEWSSRSTYPVCKDLQLLHVYSPTKRQILYMSTWSCAWSLKTLKMLLNLTSCTASATPCMERASWVSWCRILLVWEASLPPFRSNAFPLAIAKAETWNTKYENHLFAKKLWILRLQVRFPVDWPVGDSQDVTQRWQARRQWVLWSVPAPGCWPPSSSSAPDPHCPWRTQQADGGQWQDCSALQMTDWGGWSEPGKKDLWGATKQNKNTSYCQHIGLWGSVC